MSRRVRPRGMPRDRKLKLQDQCIQAQGSEVYLRSELGGGLAGVQHLPQESPSTRKVSLGTGFGDPGDPGERLEWPGVNGSLKPAQEAVRD